MEKLLTNEQKMEILNLQKRLNIIEEKTAKTFEDLKDLSISRQSESANRKKEICLS